MAEKKLKKCDAVEWDSSQGAVKGKVVGKVTGTKKVKGHIAKASQENPEYEVKSDKTGATAIHKPSELRVTKASAKASQKSSTKAVAKNSASKKFAAKKSPAKKAAK